MSALRVSWILAAFVLLGHEYCLAAEPAPADAAQFLKQSGLEAVHATYAKYFTLLSENKAEAASQLLVDSFPQQLNNATLEQLQKITDLLRAVFARGIEDVELVGAMTMSSKCVALYYVVNGKHGPTVVVLVPNRWEGNWHTHSWFVTVEMAQVMQHLKGITRFSKALVVLKVKGKTA